MKFPLLVPAAILALIAGAGCAKTPVERLAWVTMGTEAAVQVRGASGEEAAKVQESVRTVFSHVERLLNAHDKRSELSRLAPLSDDEVLAKCDWTVRECYRRAFELSTQTGGAFTPRWRGTNTLDLGAIAKGYAVDCAAKELWARGCPHEVLIDLGGNLMSVKGEWSVGIAGSESSFTLKPGMGCATSADYYRGKHIFDARTHRPVTNGVWSVTVVDSSSAMMADGLSTVMFILGREKGMDFMRRFYPDVKVYWEEKKE